jgi:HNH endonuclease/NUMOD4 motif
MEKEIWKDVVGYEGLYQVSNLGNVKYLNKLKKQSINASGYLVTALTKNNKQKITYIHKIVAEAFLDKKYRKNKLVIDHINDNKLDNRVENLQIVTQRYNAYKTQGKYSSDYKGVSVLIINNGYKTYIYYRAKIFINKKDVVLGNFKTEIEAHNAYQNALKNI